MNRREFIARAGTAAAATVLMPGLAADDGRNRGASMRSLWIAADPNDPVIASDPGRWALAELCRAASDRGLLVRNCPQVADAPANEICVLAAGVRSASARACQVPLPSEPEAFTVAPTKSDGRRLLVAVGADPRGLTYALTDLADALAQGDPLETIFTPEAGVAERPANRVRGVMRMVVSEVEDRGWFHDRAFWQRYLTLLASQRFNRFNLALGLGYDRPNELTDTFFYFAYPFLVSVPGYTVSATGVSRAEQAQNLESLRYISDQAAARGLHFQLGIWTHAFVWNRSPRANHRIEGLTAATQAPYCRDALAILLRECPNISGITFRIHGESGVPEGSYDLWRTIFDGCVRSGRRIEIDMHAKGMDQPTLDVALATGLPVTVSPKFSAEHLGLPYHQAAIRTAEQPHRLKGEGLYAQSSGARSFLRYGYGDLLRSDRRYRIVHRVWPGTQHLLLWGDPLFASAYGRAMHLGGTDGGEIFDPLSFKGREGSSRPGRGGRDGYDDPSLRPPGGDLGKYAYSYRVWGRGLYGASSEEVGRGLRRELGAAALPAGRALAQASRVLPLVTTAHLPTASNYTYWPEMGVNFPLLAASNPRPYGETKSPCRFGNASPLDPQLFMSPDEFAPELLRGRRPAKYSPLEVAQWLEDLAEGADHDLATACRAAGEVPAPAFRRVAVDVRVQAELGRFYAAKLRAAVLLAVFERTGDPLALQETIRTYRAGRDAWKRIAEVTRGVYVPDLTFGAPDFQRGHWQDRLPGIEADLTQLEKWTAPLRGFASSAIELARSRPHRPRLRIAHRAPPPSFSRGSDLPLRVSFHGPPYPVRVRLHYRHAQQAENWRRAEMEGVGSLFSAVIPAAYTDTPYPLLYYFEADCGAAGSALHPGLGADLCGAPYFILLPQA